MSEEFSIAAGRFAAALREQRAMHLPGGLYYLNQVEFAYNSNRIEGSRLTEDQTRYLYQTRTVTGDALLDDVVETANTFRLFDQMLDHVGTPITTQIMKAYHSTLKSGTEDADKEWFAVGDWKRVPNVVGARDTPTTPPAEVEAAIASLLAGTPERMSFEDICDFHYRFERIHPFQDGNGRIGRILMFEQCLDNDIMPFIVLDSEKSFYYRGLDRYETEPGFLRDTFRHFQDMYDARFGDYVPRPVDSAVQQNLSAATFDTK